MVKAAKIALVLGGEKVLKRRIRSLDDLREAVAHGLPKATLRQCVSYVFPERREARQMMAQIVRPATFKRRHAVLEPEESERVERLARVVATAEHVWDDKEDARAFLLTPHPILRSERPIDVARTELGAREVEELLMQLMHGLPA